MHVRQNFTNRMSVLTGADVIVLRDDMAFDLGEAAKARRVIRNCGSVRGHPFFYVNDCEIRSGTGDSRSLRGFANMPGPPFAWPGRSWKAKP